jgi:hypothetical protein
MLRALLGILFALISSSAWAQCNQTTYPAPVSGGLLFGNCTPAANLTPADTVVGWQPGQPTGQQTRAFSLAQIQAYVLGGGGGGPFLPIAGGSVTGTLGVTGAAGSSRVIQFLTGGTANANRRWSITANSSDDLQVFAFSDTGSSLGTLLLGTRTTGSITFNNGSLFAAPLYTFNGFMQNNNGINITGTYTSVAGTGWLPGSASNPPFSSTVDLQGTNDTGVPTPYFVQINDTVNAEARPTQMPYVLWLVNYNAGADGGRQPFTYLFTKSAASTTGNNNFIAYSNFAHYTSGEGGTAGIANAKGAYWLHNDDIQCGGAFMRHCIGNEFDYRHLTGASSLQDTIFALHNGTDDDGHGTVIDTMLSLDSANGFTPGHGGRRKAITFGTAGTAWPLDINEAQGALIGIEPWVYGSLGTTGVLAAAAKYYAPWGVDFRIGHFTTAAWASPGWTLDGHGQVNTGPSTLTYGAGGTLLRTPNFQTVSAVVVAGGNFYKVGDELMDSIGGLWTAATLTGSAVATVTQLEVGYGAACPASPTAVTGGVGTGATLNITCSQPLKTTVGASAETVSIDGGTVLAANLPTSAPATHCALWANAGVITRTTCP